MFKVGQKVICVKPIENLIKGRIYTVMFYGRGKLDTSVYGVILKEVESKESLTGGYKADRFRPLDETFATEVLEQIKEQIEQEELVLINQ